MPTWSPTGGLKALSRLASVRKHWPSFPPLNPAASAVPEQGGEAKTLCLCLHDITPSSHATDPPRTGVSSILKSPRVHRIAGSRPFVSSSSVNRSAFLSPAPLSPSPRPVRVVAQRLPIVGHGPHPWLPSYLPHPPAQTGSVHGAWYRPPRLHFHNPLLLSARTTAPVTTPAIWPLRGWASSSTRISLSAEPPAVEGTASGEEASHR